MARGPEDSHRLEVHLSHVRTPRLNLINTRHWRAHQPCREWGLVKSYLTLPNHKMVRHSPDGDKFVTKYKELTKKKNHYVILYLNRVMVTRPRHSWKRFRNETSAVSSAISRHDEHVFSSPVSDRERKTPRTHKKNYLILSCNCMITRRGDTPSAFLKKTQIWDVRRELGDIETWRACVLVAG